ncbi:Noc2p-Noc3p complex subunit Noc2 family protein [Schizosaccharomyces cryophilus OY26]|uniref:Noc2p-Noc3p complex subunit Noc2 family protein n=1 Tax=Schizosaccharomyces cryophilus (strain OY26 / ATCC MYA-4695 / CBS 11777 / NBRC 106824 / NRRL Y48691) TaxID=653667 RepID=S9W2E4_SCHCR|nr:Noc2p-Noc3p complex subunit Noc2 family protein [Schizosaccharomyces cryophilus OY26]EPY52569.1 Noc2p-Noc3p complex subunit Noc2 family protein [Schizosaccharomyces cryophilus OY26]
MGKASKATKKFNKNHLKDTLERRRGLAKEKRNHESKKKKSLTAQEKKTEDISDFYAKLDPSKATLRKDGDLVKKQESTPSGNDKAQETENSLSKYSTKELEAAIAFCQKLSGTEQPVSLLSHLPQDLKKELTDMDFNQRSSFLQDCRMSFASLLLDEVLSSRGDLQILSSVKEVILHIKSFSSFSSSFISKACRIFISYPDSRELIQMIINHICNTTPSLIVSTFQYFYVQLISFFKSSPAQSGNLDTVEEMQLFLIELLSLSHDTCKKIFLSYTHQLNTHLQNCLKQADNVDAHKLIYNWQFTLSLQFWSEVICLLWEDLQTICKEISPQLINLILDTMRLIPSEQYYPMRLRLLSSLVRICRSSHLYIPLSSHFVEMAPFFLKKSRNLTREKDSAYNFDVLTTLHIPKECLASQTYRKNLRKVYLSVMTEYFATFSNSIAFPELAVPAISQFRTFISRYPSENSISQFVEKLVETYSFIQQKRLNIEFTQKDHSQVIAFEQELDWRSTPIGKAVR